MPLITLKIDADTYRGTREGIPNLLRILARHRAQASFLFTLGPDHTGWALRQIFRPGFFRKVARTSVIEHYGLKTLMYGVLLPAPDIGRRCAAQLRAVRDAGHECGVHTWDHRVWQDHVQQRDAAWTERTMQRAFERFAQIFGTPAPTHGAAGWQMNASAFEYLDTLGIAYASDGRARLADDGALLDPAAGPHRLQIGGRALHCIQLPTTLPTLDELLGRNINGSLITAANVAALLLGLTEHKRDHVFTLHAELEGQKLSPIFEQLLIGWQAQGYQFASMATYHEQLRQQALPLVPLQFAELPGRSGTLVVQ